MKIKRNTVIVILVNVLLVVLLFYFFNSFFEGIEKIRAIAPRVASHSSESWRLLMLPLVGCFSCFSIIVTSFKAAIIKFF